MCIFEALASADFSDVSMTQQLIHGLMGLISVKLYMQELTAAANTLQQDSKELLPSYI